MRGLVMAGLIASGSAEAQEAKCGLIDPAQLVEPGGDFTREILSELYGVKPGTSERSAKAHRCSGWNLRSRESDHISDGDFHTYFLAATDGLSSAFNGRMLDPGAWLGPNVPADERVTISAISAIEPNADTLMGAPIRYTCKIEGGTKDGDTNITTGVLSDFPAGGVPRWRGHDECRVPEDATSLTFTVEVQPKGGEWTVTGEATFPVVQ